ncbi:CBS domain-containing protein [Myroides phaeus]|uniref:CBS domain-containing protein n=1 Tax=Myroides phaeus TaxID=702745 RepID=UPI002DBCEC80|nr:CBS domain-containing protein [Myroides phaeus]MEC4115584.1 CBS domain-containing protein [Myroides phaeus]
MLASENLLTTDLPICKMNTLIEEILPQLEGYSFTHFPIVDQNNNWLGNILLEDLQNASPAQSVEDIMYDIEKFYLVNHNDLNPFDFFDLFHKNDTNIIPLIDENGLLLGVFSKETLLNQWSKTLFFEEKGTSFVVAKHLQHYSFTEITQIVESNNAKILGILLLEASNDMFHILIKTNGINTQVILDDLRRYNYEIQTNLLDDSHYNDLKERSDYLNKYLNI